jgi:uncharacterized alkaline shock family protein YloU
MNMLRRLLLCLWSLVLIALGAALAVCAFRPAATQYGLDRLYRLLTGSAHFWWLLLAAVTLFLCGVLGVFVSLARKSTPSQVVVGKSESGQVNISLEAVDNVVHKAALSVAGVKDIKSRLKTANNGLGIYLQIAIPHDTNVPETATAVQNAVKEQLQLVTGLMVTEVAVLVSTVDGKAAYNAIKAD